jgi:hypothetical protein
MKGSAIFSADGIYRYELRRVWNPKRPPYCAIMLNPSTADARKNDPTVHRQIKRANLMGFGSLIVLNAGAGRNTDPKKWAAMEDPIGPQNFAVIKRVFEEVRDRNGIIVAGWGNNAGRALEQRIMRIAQSVGVVLHCLGVTSTGSPVHPLYVSYEKEPERWLGVSYLRAKPKKARVGLTTSERTRLRKRLNALR